MKLVIFIDGEELLFMLHGMLQKSSVFVAKQFASC